MLAAAALLLLVGPFEVGPRPTALVRTAAPRKIRVAVIGDSLISESAAEQRDALEARGYEVEVHASRGRALSTPWIQRQVLAVAADPDVDVVVVATAANDNFANSALAAEIGDRDALEAYRQQLRATRSRLGDRCVVLVDARDAATGWFAPGFASKTNAALREVASSRPHTEVVAWSDLSRPHGREWFAWDLEHFSGRARQARSTGAVAYAEATADGVDRCAAGH